MINLKRFFENLFDTDRISDDNIRKFSNDHIQRLVAANGDGSLTGMINDTEGAYIAYFGAITDEDTAFALQQAKTISVDNIIEEFKDAVSQHEGLVRSTFGKGTPEYEEFFPLGVTEYRQAIKENMPTLTKRMADAGAKYQAQLGDDFAELFALLDSNYNAAREAQLEQKGEVSGDKTETADSRDVIEIQLMSNLLELAKQNIGEPDKLSVFFDQSIIRPDEPAEEEEEPEPPPIEP